MAVLRAVREHLIWLVSNQVDEGWICKKISHYIMSLGREHSFVRLSPKKWSVMKTISVLYCPIKKPKANKHPTFFFLLCKTSSHSGILDSLFFFTFMYVLLFAGSRLCFGADSALFCLVGWHACSDNKFKKNVRLWTEPDLVSRCLGTVRWCAFCL